MSGRLEPRPIAQGDRRPFIVSPDGEATGEITHLQQVGLEFIRLSPGEPVAEIDARKVAGQEIQVLLLDFGMPPRALTISGDFKTEYETTSSKYTEENDNSPNTLELTCPAYGWSNSDRASTHYYDSGMSVEHSISLRRGHFMALNHSGATSEIRNGFIEHDAEIVLSDDWPKDKDIDDAGANLLSVGYVGHSILIKAQDATNAFIIYGKSIGFADRHVEAAGFSSAELESFLGRLTTQGGEQVVRELFESIASLATQHEVAVGQVETLEALLANSKSLLASERNRTWRLERELRHAKEAGQEATSTSGSEEWFNRAFGTSGASSNTAGEACKILGLDPTILELDPTLIRNMVSMARKAWSKSLHSDITGSREAEEKLKSVNNAADALEKLYR